MKITIYTILWPLLFITESICEAHTGTCEVYPPSQKEKYTGYLECLLNEVKKSDDPGDMKVLADAYDEIKNYKKSRYWYQKAIEKGDVEAMYILASKYIYYPVTYKSFDEDMKKLAGPCDTYCKTYFNQPEKAIPLYKKAALANYKDAIVKLSKTMKALYGVDGSIQRYKADMAAGDENAYRFLGNFYVYIGKPKKALSLYKEQLQQRPNDAMLYTLIGSLYHSNLHNKDTALPYYKKAAKLGSAGAMYNLGIIAGDAGRYDEAQKWFEAAAKAGIEKAARMKCYMYWNKMDDAKKAKECWIHLAKKGDPDNMLYAGIVLMDSLHEEKEALYWLQKAYEAGNSGGAIDLGYYYWKGKGHDKEKATMWYKRAAAMGDGGGWSYLYHTGIFK